MDYELKNFFEHFYNTAITIIGKNSGVINKFLGDGLFAVFPPYSSEICLRCSFEIKNSFDHILSGVEEFEKLPLEGVRFAIVEGKAYEGIYGLPEYYTDFTYLGRDVNLVFRLVDEAKSGQILIPRATAAWLSSFKKVDLPPIKVKGFSDTINVMWAYDIQNSNYDVLCNDCGQCANKDSCLAKYHIGVVHGRIKDHEGYDDTQFYKKDQFIYHLALAYHLGYNNSKRLECYQFCKEVSSKHEIPCRNRVNSKEGN